MEVDTECRLLVQNLAPLMASSELISWLRWSEWSDVWFLESHMSSNHQKKLSGASCDLLWCRKRILLKNVTKTSEDTQAPTWRAWTTMWYTVNCNRDSDSVDGRRLPCCYYMWQVFFWPTQQSATGVRKQVRKNWRFRVGRGQLCVISTPKDTNWHHFNRKVSESE